MNTSPEFNKIVTRVHKLVKDQCTRPELEELLTIEEGAYERDSTRSVGKHLVILSIDFSGIKTTGEAIHYYRKPELGVNLWVGDNLVGKSSIFRVVKLAITGRDSLDEEISGWIRNIWVEFTLGPSVYTSHIYRNEADKYFSYEFYNASREELSLLDEAGVTDAREYGYTGGSDRYEHFLERFFFKEFYYYNMQWTSKKGGKMDVGLNLNNASWKTYFKSIYLEAEDSNTLMYGAQADLMLQMLLGLELTFPLNRLKVRKENLQSELGLLSPAAPRPAANKERIEAVQKELTSVDAQIQVLTTERQTALKPVINEASKQLEDAINKQTLAVKRVGELTIAIDKYAAKETELRRQESDLKKTIKEYGISIIKKRKRAQDLRDYEDLGAFFNGLQVKTCPSCSHEVEQAMIEQEKQTGSCRLCSNHVEAQTVAPGTYTEQIQELLDQAQKLKEDQYQYEVRRAQIINSIEQTSKEILVMQQELNSLSLPAIAHTIASLQAATIAKATPFDVEKHLQANTKLAVRKAELQKELTALHQPTAGPDDRQQLLDKQINILSIAHDEISRIQEERSKSLLKKLADLYLQQLHAFGLINYEDVTIDNKFRINYIKFHKPYSFEKLTAGEQLRAKLGLYIALIQLDVQHRHGRHSRFIILDSPAKEEADHTFVDGLLETLAYIEKELGQNLQVFIGTAERRLATAVDKEKVEIRGDKEYFF
jgi:hypothetical protein